MDVATEHVLQCPTLVLIGEPVFIVLCLLRPLQIGSPVEHLGISAIVAHQEHGHGCGVGLLDNAVDDSGDCIFERGRLGLAFVLATDHYSHRADGENHESFHICRSLLEALDKLPGSLG